MWEDNHNINGGRWLINLNKQQRSTELDNFWMEVVSCFTSTAQSRSHVNLKLLVINVLLLYFLLIIILKIGLISLYYSNMHFCVTIVFMNLFQNWWYVYYF